MNPRTWCCATALAVVLGALTAIVPGRVDAAVRPSRPNIVFILTDDMALADLTAMPATKRLVAEHGATFDQFLVSDPACCPSRATILTGRYAHNTGVLSNSGEDGGFETAHRLGIERSTVATRLSRAGYRTGLFGKYLNGYPNGVSATWVPWGWHTWVSPVAGDPYSQYGYTLNVNGALVPRGYAPDDYGTDVFARAARRFIRRSAIVGRPFFAALTVYAPHQPAVPALRDAHRQRRARAPRTPSFDQADVGAMPAFVRVLPRFGAPERAVIDRLHRRRVRSLQAVDRAVASLVHTLRDAGQLDNTYVVFSSDNGFHLGQHRLPAGKYTAYEADIHVPLLIRGPGVPAGSHIGALTGNIDLAPTFEAMAGVRRPASNDGRALLGLARDPSSSTRWSRRDYLIEHRRERGRTSPARPELLPLEPPDPEATPAVNVPPGEILHRSHDWKLLRRVGGIPDYDAVRTRRWLYVEYETGDRELYDLQHDPDEIDNLAGRAHAATERRLARRLEQLRNCAGASCRAGGRDVGRLARVARAADPPIRPPWR